LTVGECPGRLSVVSGLRTVADHTERNPSEAVMATAMADQQQKTQVKRRWKQGKVCLQRYIPVDLARALRVAEFEYGDPGFLQEALRRELDRRKAHRCDSA
jgi:hypothetical protein